MSIEIRVLTNARVDIMASFLIAHVGVGAVCAITGGFVNVERDICGRVPVIIIEQGIG